MYTFSRGPVLTHQVEEVIEFEFKTLVAEKPLHFADLYGSARADIRCNFPFMEKHAFNGKGNSKQLASSFSFPRARDDSNAKTREGVSISRKGVNGSMTVQLKFVLNGRLVRLPPPPCPVPVNDPVD